MKRKQNYILEALNSCSVPGGLHYPLMGLEIQKHREVREIVRSAEKVGGRKLFSLNSIAHRGAEGL